MTEFKNLPSIGDMFPEMEVKTTFGSANLPKDYKGKWFILFSHPADFTPVCTTEFVALAQANDEFQAMNTQLLALSIDSVHSHIAWIRNIKEKMGVDIPFPVIADLDMKVATLYGMVHPGQSSTATVRTVFFIDDKGILRAMIYYPLSNGRSIPELIRLVKALQLTDKEGAATPANWQPGDKVVVPPPKTVSEAEKRVQEGYEYKDFYLCFRNV